jgi:hypothetical protein
MVIPFGREILFSGDFGLLRCASSERNENSGSELKSEETKYKLMYHI